MKCYRQGDVIIKQINKISDLTEYQEKQDTILAEGETKGHKHKIIEGQVKLMVLKTAVNALFPLMVLRVLSEKAVLFHEEHNQIELPYGDYQVLIQREYDWFTEGIRRVLD
jgi:hypothetical protein